MPQPLKYWKPPVELKEPHKYTMEELNMIREHYGQDYHEYCIKEKNTYRNKKINKILNSQK